MKINQMNLIIVCIYLCQVVDAEHEADGVQDVTLARSVQTRDGVELRVEARHDCLLCITLKSIDNNLLNIHLLV